MSDIVTREIEIDAREILKTAKNLTLCKKFPLIRVSFRIGIKAEAGTVKIVNL
jgi:hypothetical protein